MQNKRFVKEIDEFNYHNEHTSLTLGTLSVMFAFLVMLIVVTFTGFHISHIWFGANENGFSWVSKNYFYVAQIPFVIFMGAILGIRYSFLTLIIYILLGFFAFPAFGFGGGLGYIKTYFFGYILGYFPCVFLTGFFLRKFKGYKAIITATVTSVTSVYLTGFLYGIILLIFRQLDLTFVLGTLNSSNGLKFLYDLIFSVLFILASYPVKKILWIAIRNEYGDKKQNWFQKFRRAKTQK